MSRLARFLFLLACGLTWTWAAACGDGGPAVDGGLGDGVVDDGGPDAGGDAAGDPDGSDGQDGDGAGPALTGIELQPAQLDLEVGQTSQLAASAEYADGSQREVTPEVTWVLEPGSPVTVEAGLVSALRAGQTTVRARIGVVMSNACLVTVQEAASREARGIWVTRWNFSNPADVQTIVSRAADAGFNQIYFQVRGTADAYYASNLEPWSAGLTGSLGRDPGWDPLQEAIDAAHAAGLELHAWINSLPSWNCGAALPASEGIAHMFEQHPDWAAADANGVSMLGNCSDGYVSASPGIPEVREHIRAVVEDLIDQYAVDGVHLDYIRYPGPQYSHDAVSASRFAQALAAEPGLTWEDWQRRQINALVQSIYQTVLDHRPDIALSAAVWFIRQNIWGWSSVSQGYSDYYQDPRAWMAGGYIDAIVPMIYFPLTDPPGGRLDFAAMLQDHLDGAAGRHVYAGIHGDYADFGEIAAEIDAQRVLGAQGLVIFAYTYLVSHDTFDDLAAGPLAEPAEPPDLPWRNP
jgi:uncharacterized lipoprotein YddW (UPF0748 family)